MKHKRSLGIGLMSLFAGTSALCIGPDPVPASEAAAQKFVSHIESLSPQSGFIIALYELPKSERRTEALRVLIGYDVESRAWFKIHAWNGGVFGRDKTGRLIEGHASMGAIGFGEEAPELPIDDTPVEEFLPFAFLNGMHDRPESFMRTYADNEGGLVCDVSLPLGRRFGERLCKDATCNKTVLFGVDSKGRLSWKQRLDQRAPTTYQYSDRSPEGFSLPDSANGGQWRLVSAEAHPDGGADLITPEAIEVLARNYGVLK